MFVYEAMSTFVVAVTADSSAAQAATEMIVRDITGLPVIDQDGTLLGVVTELDLLRAARHGRDLSDLTVAEVMDERPLFVSPETNVNTAIDLMQEWQVRRLPVCVGNRLVGIVSRGDILAKLVDTRRARPLAAAMG